MIQALVFDFDGLILETEEADYLAWKRVFQAQAADLPLEVWVDCIGRGAEYFDPPAYLEQRLGHPIERARLITDHDARFLELVHAQSIRPGVREYTEDAKRLHLKLGIASSSSRAWVTGHLDRLALSACWDSIRCREDVLHAKPEPELYDAVLTDLKVPPEQAVAIEDSPNGITAAKRAGMRCVAVPNVLTRALDLSRADLQLSSLKDVPLLALIQQLSGT